MDTPSTRNYEVYMGATFDDSFTYFDSKTDAAYDLTGAKIRMQVRPEAGGELILDLSTENEKIKIGNATKGEFSFVVSAAETADISRKTEWREARYDIVIEQARGVYVVCRGDIKFLMSITKEF